MTESKKQASNNNELGVEEQVEYRREMRQHVISFIMMIFLTIIAFVAVAMDVLTPAFTALFIIILASIQFVFQIYVFMHMGQKDHEYPTLAIWTGFFVALLCIGGIAGLIW